MSVLARVWRSFTGAAARLGRQLSGPGTPTPRGERAETSPAVAAPPTEIAVRVAAAVERLKREPVAWLRNYQGDEPLEKLEDAWFKGESEWTLFSVGHFFEIKVVGGRVVQRDAPRGDRSTSLEIQWRLDRDFSLVAIPESVRGEILRKTDTKNFPLLLENCRIVVIGQMTTGMPVVRNEFGPVDRRNDPEGWASASRALMALLGEVEDFRRIQFEEASKATPP